jgi:hypothetical protein
MAWWQLQKRAEIDGTARDAGYCFQRPDDWKVPPMDTMRNPDNANEFVDVPIAVPVKDEAILARLAQQSDRLTIGHGDDDVARPLDPDTKTAERGKIDAAGAEGAGVAATPAQAEALDKSIAHRDEVQAQEAKPAAPFDPAAQAVMQAPPAAPIPPEPPRT